MRLSVTLVIVTAAAVATSAVALAALSPKAELAAMRTAVLGEHSVRYVSVDTESTYKARITADVGPSKGIEQITVTEYGQTGPAYVRVTRKKAYLKGTKFTLDVFFGFSPALAKKYAGRWISVPRTNSAFKVIATGVTFQSFTASLFPVAPLHLVTEGNLIGVAGSAPGAGQLQNQTILAPSHRKPLPARLTTTPAAGQAKDVWTISRWNETVHVPVPLHSVPIRIVTGG